MWCFLKKFCWVQTLLRTSLGTSLEANHFKPSLAVSWHVISIYLLCKFLAKWAIEGCVKSGHYLRTVLQSITQKRLWLIPWWQHLDDVVFLMIITKYAVTPRNVARKRLITALATKYFFLSLLEPTALLNENDLIWLPSPSSDTDKDAAGLKLWHTKVSSKLN